MWFRRLAPCARSAVIAGRYTELVLFSLGEIGQDRLRLGDGYAPSGGGFPASSALLLLNHVA